MRSRDLAEPFPLVLPDTDAPAAARAMAAERPPGLIVCDKEWRAYTVLAGPDLLRALVPGHLRDAPLPARAADEGASHALAWLPPPTVRHLLPRADLDAPALVHAEAAALEVATVMARTHSPLVAVNDDRQVIGVVPVDRPPEHLLPADGA